MKEATMTPTGGFFITKEIAEGSKYSRITQHSGRTMVYVNLEGFWVLKRTWVYQICAFFISLITNSKFRHGFF